MEQEKKRSTPREGKRGPRRWGRARAADGEPEKMRGRNEAEDDEEERGREKCVREKCVPSRRYLGR